MNKTAGCVSFYSMQMTRLIMIIFVLFVWGANFFVNVKKCVLYLNFWALTFTLLYLLCVLPSAGRQEVERQLLRDGKLEDSEKSSSWKKALFFYSLALPFSMTSVVLSSAFFIREQICATYLDFGVAQWRDIVVILATYIPLPVLLIDLSMNRINTSYKHVILHILFFGLYVFFTFVGESIQNRPIYGKYLAFK